MGKGEDDDDDMVIMEKWEEVCALGKRDKGGEQTTETKGERLGGGGKKMG